MDQVILEINVNIQYASITHQLIQEYAVDTVHVINQTFVLATRHTQEVNANSQFVTIMLPMILMSVVDMVPVINQTTVLAVVLILVSTVNTAFALTRVPTIHQYALHMVIVQVQGTVYVQAPTQVHNVNTQHVTVLSILIQRHARVVDNVQNKVVSVTLVTMERVANTRILVVMVLT
jgi:hypothetical protein